MGVVSNKVDIELLKIHNDVGSLDARVTAIEDVDLPKVYSSISEITDVELPKVYSSISAVSDLILEPVTGLEDRVENIESYTDYNIITIDNMSGTKTNAEVFAELNAALAAIAENHVSIITTNMTVYIDNAYYTCRGERLTKIGDGNGSLLSNVYIYGIPELSATADSITFSGLYINIKKTNTGQSAYYTQWKHYFDGTTPDTFNRYYTDQTNTTNIIKNITLYYKLTNV